MKTGVWYVSYAHLRAHETQRKEVLNILTGLFDESISPTSKKLLEVVMALPKSAETKKVNLDFNKKFIDTFTQNIEEGNVVFINQTLKDLHEADVANLIENLSPDTRTKLFEIESFNIDPEIFIELNESILSLIHI